MSNGIEDLPSVLARYIEAGNARDEEAFVACFADNAVVEDEQHRHSGHEEIRLWFRRTRDEYDFQAEPKALTESNGKAVLVCTVSGNFPGSPVELSYRFEIANGKIARLGID